MKCVFCGEERAYPHHSYFRDDGAFWWIFCDRCGGRSGEHDTEAAAIAEWERVLLAATIDEWIEQYNEQQLRACQAEARVKTLRAACEAALLDLVDWHKIHDCLEPEGCITCDIVIPQLEDAIADAEGDE